MSFSSPTIKRAARRAPCSVALGLAASLLAVAVPAAQASCAPSTARQKVQRADAVFVGRVLAVSANGASAKFRVLSVRKGAVRTRSVVRVSARPYPSSVTIDWRPRAGQRWRVYADRDGRRWVTNDCMGTRRIA